MSRDPDLGSFPLVPKGRQFEDFAEGQSFEHHWGRTLGESDNTLFATHPSPTEREFAPKPTAKRSCNTPTAPRSRSSRARS